MNKILVTGSSGFIGTHLCHALVEEGYNVEGVDISQPKFELPESIETHITDLTEPTELPESDIIVHLAAHSQVQPVVESPELALENIQMTQNILSEADRMDASVINISSRDIYGNSLQPSEDESTIDSPNGYAASKISSEALSNAFRHTMDVSVTSLRLANVYGSMDTNQRVIPIFIALADAGEELTVFGKQKLLDFIHVDDVCRAIQSTINRSEITDGEAINIGSGVGTSLPEIASYISESIESCPGWSVSDNRTGDVGQYVSDISKSRSILNFEPEISLNKGMDKTIDWYLNSPEMLETIRSKL
ncbi:NAD-dependent epimerase/dehydratase family protein [Halorutilales archaeon Cl-col2-1]